MNSYISVHDYRRAPTGLETATLVGNVCTLSSPVILGATSLPVTPALTVALAAGDRITLFDGSSTEIVTMTAPAIVGATSLAVSATTYAHATGTSLCSDGIRGSLADMIINASAELEAYCRQPLLQASYSNEKLPLRSMRAAVTRDYQLTLRPKRFPVQSVSGVVAQLDANTTLTLNVAQAMIDADAQLVTLAQMTTTSSVTPYILPPLRQTTPGWIELSYVAGYAYASLPPDIRQAAIYLVSAVLADRKNPLGAIEVQLGKSRVKFAERHSQILNKAYERLDSYRQKAF